MSSAPAETRETRESLFSKCRLAVAGLALTFAGTMVSTWFSDRSSTWQAYVAKIDKDTEATLAAYRNAADLINERWYAFNKMADAIQNSAGDEDWKAAREQYSAVDKDWAMQFTKIESDIRFNVDETFPIETSPNRENRELELISLMPCARTVSGEKWHSIYETNSARVVMAVVNHCLGTVKTELDEAIDSKSSGASHRLDPNAVQNLLKRSRDELDLVYWTHSTLRCLVLERELALRSIAVTQSYWNKFFGSLPTRYDLPPDGENCHATWIAHAEQPNIELSKVQSQLD
jgi:hypothetical protein